MPIIEAGEFDQYLGKGRAVGYTYTLTGALHHTSGAVHMLSFPTATIQI